MGQFQYKEKKYIFSMKFKRVKHAVVTVILSLIEYSRRNEMERNDRFLTTTYMTV